jgi:predicted DsbA family dithiol-disulfide isomerase
LNANAEPLTIDCYSDVVCVWAYGLQARVDALHREFGKAMRINHHFIPVFGNTDDKVVQGWEKQGGAAAYGAHVRGVAERLGVEVHPEVWVRNRPATCLTAHLVLQAVKRLRDTGDLRGVCADDFDARCLVEELAWRIRLAFFRDLQDVGRMDILEPIVAQLGVPLPALREEIASGRALAMLSRDIDARQDQRIEGSPTFIMNSGRQKLYGNLSPEILSANVRALLSG